MEKIFKLTHPAEAGVVVYVKEKSVGNYIKNGWEAQEGFFLPKEEKPKYRYDIVDSAGTVICQAYSRKGARGFKRLVEELSPHWEGPPYKIIRYQLVNPTHIR